MREEVPAELPLSAAIGDLPSLPGTAALAALGAARSGATYVKLGLWGPSTREEAVAVLRAAREAVDGDAAVVACAYADAARVPGGRWRRASWSRRRGRRAWPAACSTPRSRTAAGCCRGWIETLAVLVAEAHGAGLEMALAGELRAEDLPAIRATGADIAGVRSAACRDGRRAAAIDPVAHRARCVTNCALRCNEKGGGAPFVGVRRQRTSGVVPWWQ